MSDYKKLEYLCKIFREIVMPVWIGRDSVKMTLPYRFSDFAPAMIEARIMPDGKIRVSDRGLIAAHEPADVNLVKDETGGLMVVVSPERG